MLLNVLLVLAGLAGALFALPHVLGAFVRYFVVPFWQVGRTIPIDPPYEPIELTAPDVPEAMIDAARQLSACGFSAQIHLFGDKDIPHTKSWGSLWRHRADTCAARVVFVRAELPGAGRLEEAVIAFETDFTDGSSIITTNLASPSLYSPDPAIATIHWRGQGDLATLYRLHRARVQLHEASRVPKPFTDPLEHFHERGRRTMRRQVGAGYLVLDSNAGVYRMTLKGGFLTYRLSWPLSGMIMSGWNRAVRAELAACGMGRPEDYETGPRVSDSTRS